MAILKVRDEEGNVTEIPAIKGKSAYEYAKDGGYTGTEEEFAELMANGTGGGLVGTELTQAEYDALPEEEKNNGLYFITDGVYEEEVKPNENFIINANFMNPINKRGLTQYNNDGNMYTINKWFVTGDTNRKVFVRDGYVELSNVNGSCFIINPLDYIPLGNGKTYTVSANINGKVRTLTFVNTSDIATNQARGDYDDGACILVQKASQGNYIQIAIGHATGTSSKLYWAKLEEGSVATPFVKREFVIEYALCDSEVAIK